MTLKWRLTGEEGATQGRGQQAEKTPARENQPSQHHFSKLDFLLKADFKVSKITRLVL